MLVKVASAGVAALVLAATGGGTLGSFEDTSTVRHNVIGAGVLKLDVRSVGTGANLALNDLRPGSHATQLFWATNGLESSVPATLSITVHDLVDVPAPCNVSAEKADGESLSGIGGCQVTSTGITGIPNTGVVSRLIDVSSAYDPGAQVPEKCADDPARAQSLRVLTEPGDLYAIANANDGAGTTVPITDARGHAVVLPPGHGICVVVSVSWPRNGSDIAHASPRNPVDDAAQGDSASVAVRFDLAQVLP